MDTTHLAVAAYMLGNLALEASGNVEEAASTVYRDDKGLDMKFTVELSEKSGILYSVQYDHGIVRLMDHKTIVNKLAAFVALCD